MEKDEIALKILLKMINKQIFKDLKDPASEIADAYNVILARPADAEPDEPGPDNHDINLGQFRQKQKHPDHE